MRRRCGQPARALLPQFVTMRTRERHAGNYAILFRWRYYAVTPHSDRLRCDMCAA